MKSLPVRRSQFQTAEFVAWLSRNGAEIRQQTNPYEVVRYLAYGDRGKKAETHIVYAKENGLLTFTGRSRVHYEAFLFGCQMYSDGNPPEGWVRPSGEPFNKASSKKPVGAVRREKLLQRDGDECWFCGLAMGDDCTIEHLIPKSKGGGNRLDNYALAHAECNHRAADLPLVKKIELRASLRAKAIAMAPKAETACPAPVPQDCQARPEGIAQ
jgi:hypothetical protein